jgi:putative chitinase
MRAIDVVRRLAPRARPAYVRAFEDGDKVLAEYGVTTPLRLAHFLAQGFHESGGLTIVRESGAYSASRIMEIFGVNRHSARVTAAEARALAGNGPALFERVYGQGNPGKARELGNTTGSSGNYPGDGWWFRGNGLMQTTGRGAHRRLGQKLGLGVIFEEDPDKVTNAKFALLPALAEWKESDCNALADKNDLAGITRRINGGYNGKADRQAWFNKIYPLLRGDANAPAWKDAEEDEYIRTVQEQLVTLGADIKVDGRKGPATEEAIKAFQRANGLTPDGIAGAVTREMLKARVGGAKAPELPPKEFPDDKAMKSGAVQGAGAAIAGGAATVAVAVDAAKEVGDVASDARAQWAAGDVLGIVLGIAILAGGLFLLWNRFREAGKLPRWLGGTR